VKRRAAEVRVQHDAGRVDDASRRGRVGGVELRRDALREFARVRADRLPGRDARAQRFERRARGFGDERSSVPLAGRDERGRVEQFRDGREVAERVAHANSVRAARRRGAGVARRPGLAPAGYLFS
jgi:hypothetical protein